MKLYVEILLHLLETGRIPAADLPHSADALVELHSYRALRAIKAIVEDQTLDDPACFARIEAIVSVLEDLGSDGGVRHDFG